MPGNRNYWDEWGVWRGEAKVRVPVVELNQKVRAALSNVGYTPEDAAVMTDVIMAAELEGNGQGVIKLYNSGILDEALEPDGSGGGGGGAAAPPRWREIVVERETDASAVVNGNGRPGMVVVNRAVDLALAKAKAKKFALVGTYGTHTSTGALAHYARRIGRANMVGLIMGQNFELVAVSGGREPVLGTNPMCFVVPRTCAPGELATAASRTDKSDGDDPLVFDMSSSSVTYFQAMAAKASGDQLPRGTALNAAGAPTTDPTAALLGALLPFGGHKGSGLALIIELLGGVLPGGAFPGGPLSKKEAKNVGNVVMVMDPALLSDVDAFKAKVGLTCAALRRTGPDVMLPGDAEQRMRSAALRSGALELSESVFEQICELAKGKEQAVAAVRRTRALFAQAAFTGDGDAPPRAKL
jgi:LDH2 family malate/lactate/ureidoglycolate dehydrogenase